MGWSRCVCIEGLQRAARIVFPSKPYHIISIGCLGELFLINIIEIFVKAIPNKNSRLQSVQLLIHGFSYRLVRQREIWILTWKISSEGNS